MRGRIFIIQTAVEYEVSDYLGRDWYKHKQVKTELAPSYRNGYTEKTIKSSNERFRIKNPRVRGEKAPFKSELLKRMDKLDERLSQLAIEMYTRGLSTRDIVGDID